MSQSQRVLFVAVVAVGCLLRAGYGVARYGDALSRTGDDFILLWDHDALEHVLIAKALVEEQAYRVGPPIEGKRIRFSPLDALFKAPLYQYFLAGVFALSGFSFALYFPLQALIGGIASGLAALVALEVFRKRRIAVFAGLATAAHPLLVNSAAQPYNENLFVALILASTWAFIRWLPSNRLAWAVASGALGGLAILCRESAMPVVVAMAGFAIVTRPAGSRRSILAASTMVLVAAAVVLPWSVRNFIRTGKVIPVSAISATALSIGNNECVASEPLFSWYWAESSCPPLNDTRNRILASLPAEHSLDSVVRNGINGRLAMQFIRERPVDYARLSAQRAWTIFLPFHPRQPNGTGQRLLITLYWLMTIPAGLVGAIVYGRSSRGTALLLVVLAAVLVPAMLVYIAPDMRYRVPADLLLAGFAGCVYAPVLARLVETSRRFVPRGALQASS